MEEGEGDLEPALLPPAEDEDEVRRSMGAEDSVGTLRFEEEEELARDSPGRPRPLFESSISRSNPTRPLVCNPEIRS